MNASLLASTESTDRPDRTSGGWIEEDCGCMLMTDFPPTCCSDVAAVSSTSRFRHCHTYNDCEVHERHRKADVCSLARFSATRRKCKIRFVRNEEVEGKWFSEANDRRGQRAEDERTILGVIAVENVELGRSLTSAR